MFRTPTGQTGPDAYRFEAAQIANLQRKLDARAQRLAEAMAAELPEDAVVKFSIASNAFPNATLDSDAASLRKMIPMHSLARDVESLADIARALADPDHVITR